MIFTKSSLCHCDDDVEIFSLSAPEVDHCNGAICTHLSTTTSPCMQAKESAARHPWRVAATWPSFTGSTGGFPICDTPIFPGIPGGCGAAGTRTPRPRRRSRPPRTVQERGARQALTGQVRSCAILQRLSCVQVRPIVYLSASGVVLSLQDPLPLCPFPLGHSLTQSSNQARH